MLLVHFLRAKLLCALRKEDGAVTVDWIVLTGLAIVLCALLASLMADALTAGGTRIQQLMQASP